MPETCSASKPKSLITDQYVSYQVKVAVRDFLVTVTSTTGEMTGLIQSDFVSLIILKAIVNHLILRY